MKYFFFNKLVRSAIVLTAIFSGSQLVQAQAISHQISLLAGVSWCSDGMINGLFTTINAFRIKRGVPGLVMDPAGMKDAEMRAVQFSQYMAANPPVTPGFNPHQGYDSTANSLGYNLVSENLAYLTSDPNWIVNSAWQDSVHLEALTASEANITGVSCVYSNGIPFWTYEPGIGLPASQPSPSPAPTPSPGPSPGNTAALDSEESAFLALINSYRAQNGLGPLQVSATLQASSRWMSNDLATSNYFSHTDTLGRSPGTRLAAFGYTYTPWGENIAAGNSDAQNTLSQWETACDPDTSGACTHAHRTNMLNGSFTAIGIGRAYHANSSYGWYWTTDFGGYLDQPLDPGPAPGPKTAPVIGSFKSSPATISKGQGTTLSWSVSGATALSIDNGIGDVSNVTFKLVSAAQTTTFKLTATNSAGSTSAVVTVAVQGATPDTQAPTAPVITSALAKSSTEVDLSWTPSADNIGVAGYQIFRNGSILKTVPGTSATYADNSASGSATYIYVMKAYDAAGNLSAPSNSILASTPVPPSALTCPGPAVNVFTGCYYNGTSLSGNPVLVRTDTQINFDWIGGSPSPAVTPKNFSVRWQGYFEFAQGDYTFTAIASDGLRLYIDGTLILNKWQNHPVQTLTVRQTVTQGTHLVVVEFYEQTGTASAHVSRQLSSQGQAPVIASFAANPSTVISGQATTLSWNVNGATTISVDNGIGSVNNVTSTSVSPFQTTTYKLTATNSAGSTSEYLTVAVKSPVPDTQPPTVPSIISAIARSSSEVDLAWTPSSDNVGVAGYQILRNGSLINKVPGSVAAYADKAAAGGAIYTYVIKAADAAGNLSAASSSAQVNTPISSGNNTCAAPATNAFTGCYYNDTNLLGNPVLTRADSQINFDWAGAASGAPVLRNGFSVRWQGYFNFNSGPYTFTAITSDGMRVYLDGVLVFDSWRDQPANLYTLQHTLTAGQHLVAVDYYDNSGKATAHLSWQGGTSTGRR